jgi:WD40 repeat protein
MMNATGIASLGGMLRQSFRFSRFTTLRCPSFRATRSRVRCGCIAGLVALGLEATSVIAADPTTVPLLRLETGMHTAMIRRIATDAAGRFAVTASDDKTARVWEVATGRLVQVLRPPQDVGHEGKLFAVALSPDGATVAVGGWTGWVWDQQHSIYLFDRESGRLLRRLPGLPDVINHLAFSPDGRWLAASLGDGGIRVFDAASGRETGSDPDYGSDSYSAHFSPDSRRLLTTCYDGQVRLYAVEDTGLRKLAGVSSSAGKRPYAARFSPDGRSVAVGFRDTTTVQVLDASTLAETARPSVEGVGSGDLSSVEWTANGRYLVAGGAWALGAGGKWPLRLWPVGQWSSYRDVLVSNDVVMDLAPLPGGGLLFGAGDPAWGVLDAEGQVQVRQDHVLADLRGSGDELRLSSDAHRVRFGYKPWGEDPRSFDLDTRTLGPDDVSLAPARTKAPGLRIENWRNRLIPTLNGRPLALREYERSRSLAIAPDGQRFALGAEWALRLFDREGKELWSKSAPDAVWAVNISGDSRFVVAGYGDGTIRWHRLSDGQEVLAFFPHADRERWIVWTPEGFFDASPGAEELIGYHLNRGRDSEGEFVSALQLREVFYQPGLIAHRLDADGDQLMAKAVSKLGDVRKLLATKASLTPEVTLVSPLEVSGEEEVTITVRVSDQGGGIGTVVFYIDDKPQERLPARQSAGTPDAPVSRTFALPPGVRRFEVAATNRAGVEGNRKSVTATLTGPTRDEALFILAVGVESYKDPKLKLLHSVSDAQRIAEEIAARARPLFKRGVFTTVLKDQQATLSGIEASFAKLKGELKPQDTLVLFLAGHGEAPLEKGYTFLPWDFQRGAPGDAGEGLSERRLRAILEQAPSQTLLLLDTCDAGGAERMIEDAYKRLHGLTQQVLIGASRRGELAREGYEGHGVFTAALLRTLQRKPDFEDDRTLGVKEISVFVEKEVQRISKQMPGNYLQKVTGFLGSANFPVVAR